MDDDTWTIVKRKHRPNHKPKTKINSRVKDIVLDFRQRNRLSYILLQRKKYGPPDVTALIDCDCCDEYILEQIYMKPFICKGCFCCLHQSLC